MKQLLRQIATSTFAVLCFASSHAFAQAVESGAVTPAKQGDGVDVSSIILVIAAAAVIVWAALPYFKKPDDKK